MVFKVVWLFVARVPKCAATHLHQVSITMVMYMFIVVPQDCFVIFDSDGRPGRNIKSCDGGCDFEPVNRPDPPPTPTLPTMPPTTQSTQPGMA